MSTKSLIYKLLKWSNDLNAVQKQSKGRKGSIERRVKRRVAGKVAGRMMRKL